MSEKLSSHSSNDIKKDENKNTSNIKKILLEKKILTEDQFKIALIEADKSSISLIDAIIKMKFVSEAIIYDALSENKATDGISQKKQDIKSATISKSILNLIPSDFAIQNKILPLQIINNNIVLIATANPYDIITLDQINRIIKPKVATFIHYTENEISVGLEKFYNVSYAIDFDKIIDELGEKSEGKINTNQDIDNFRNPIVRFVDAILSDAVSIKASDIHIEPEERFIRIRFRVDGVLITKTLIHINYFNSLCVRVKILSNLNIAESRKPQDGAISLVLNNEEVDFRVSTIPTIYGENIVIRVLDKAKGIMKLVDLGFNNINLKLINLALKKPEGIIICTGPTGSGKTTTLYSVLDMINTVDKNIMTLEEPVEYKLPLIRQSEINAKAGFDFSSGLRSILRQDPDIVFLGEIRDEETAQTAIRAAITGHQVFSTLHTNSAISSITRLIDIGIQPFMLSGSLIAVIAQRLTRRLCPHCKIGTPMSRKMKEVFDLNPDLELMEYKPKGCDNCRNLGYKGRITISEVLFIDDEINIVIATDPTIKSISDIAKKQGFLPIQRDGILKIVQGHTSLEEVASSIDMTFYTRQLEE